MAVSKTITLEDDRVGLAFLFTLKERNVATPPTFFWGYMKWHKEEGRMKFTLDELERFGLIKQEKVDFTTGSEYIIQVSLTDKGKEELNRLISSGSRNALGAYAFVDQGFERYTRLVVENYPMSLMDEGYHVNAHDDQIIRALKKHGALGLDMLGRINDPLQPGARGYHSINERIVEMMLSGFVYCSFLGTDENVPLELRHKFDLTPQGKEYYERMQSRRSSMDERLDKKLDEDLSIPIRPNEEELGRIALTEYLRRARRANDGLKQRTEKPDFIGAWSQPHYEYMDCSFKVFVTSRDGTKFKGEIEDTLGDAEIEGEIDSDTIRFVKKYTERYDDHAARTELYYLGSKQGGKFVGTFAHSEGGAPVGTFEMSEAQSEAITESVA